MIVNLATVMIVSIEILECTRNKLLLLYYSIQNEYKMKSNY